VISLPHDFEMVVSISAVDSVTKEAIVPNGKCSHTPPVSHVIDVRHKLGTSDDGKSVLNVTAIFRCKGRCRNKSPAKAMLEVRVLAGGHLEKILYSEPILVQGLTFFFSCGYLTSKLDCVFFFAVL